MCEIQAQSAIDRATVGETRIGRGTKIDNLVQVGHASKVGEDTLLCGQVGLAGTTNIGNKCILAGQVGCAGHLTIGDGAVISAQSGVPTDVPPGAIYSGYPAMENRAWRKSVAAFSRLPDLQREVRELREEVAWMRAGKYRLAQYRGRVSIPPLRPNYSGDCGTAYLPRISPIAWRRTPMMRSRSSAEASSLS